MEGLQYHNVGASLLTGDTRSIVISEVVEREYVASRQEYDVFINTGEYLRADVALTGTRVAYLENGTPVQPLTNVNLDLTGQDWSIANSNPEIHISASLTSSGDSRSLTFRGNDYWHSDMLENYSFDSESNYYANTPSLVNGTEIGLGRLNGGTFVLSIHPTALQSDINAFIQSLSFSNASDDPGNSARIKIDYVQFLNGAQSTTSLTQVPVEIIPTNDAPSVTQNTETRLIEPNNAMNFSSPFSSNSFVSPVESGQILEELVVRVTATNASGDPASFVNAEQLSTRAGAISLAQAGTNQNHLFRVEVVEVDDATREIRYTALGNESTLLRDILYRFGDQSLTGQQRQFEVISATDNGGSVGSDEDTTTPVSGHLVANLVLFSRSNAPTVSIDGDLHRTSSFDEGDTFMGGSNGFKLFNIAWGASTNDESKGEYFATVKLTVSGLADGANEKLSLAHDDFPSDPNNVVRNYIDLVNGQGTHNISISGWSETVNTEVSVTGDTATVLISGKFRFRTATKSSSKIRIFQYQ